MKALAALRHPLAAFVLDVILVILFAAIGRANHDEASPVLGSLQTAWPFLAGTVVGWLLVRTLRKDWPVDVGPGITVWFATVVFGMVLRRLTGAGAAPSFVVVASLVLALLLVGWRAIAAYAARRAGVSA
jgi:hypothetical protein